MSFNPITLYFPIVVFYFGGHIRAPQGNTARSIGHCIQESFYMSAGVKFFPKNFWNGCDPVKARSAVYYVYIVLKRNRFFLKNFGNGYDPDKVLNAFLKAIQF